MHSPRVRGLLAVIAMVANVPTRRPNAPVLSRDDDEAQMLRQIAFGDPEAEYDFHRDCAVEGYFAPDPGLNEDGIPTDQDLLDGRDPEWANATLAQKKELMGGPNGGDRDDE